MGTVFNSKSVMPPQVPLDIPSPHAPYSHGHCGDGREEVTCLLVIRI